MKNIMRSYVVTPLALLVIFTLVFPGSSMATNDKNDKKEPASAIELKFIGNHQEQSVFQLSIPNVNADEFTVIFRDEYGNILYSGRFKGANISQKFALNTEEIGDDKLNVVVRSKKTNQSEVYSINRNVSYVEQAVVSKIN